MAKTPRLVKTLALAVVVAAIIASSGLVSAFDATSPRLSGTASASASVSAASTPAPTTEANPQAVMIKPAEDAPGALTTQKTLRDGAITRVYIMPPRAIPTQPNPPQPVFTITNTDTQTVTVWITHEGTNVDTKTETDANAGSADLQYRDAETGERLSGSDVTVTLEPVKRVLSGSLLTILHLHLFLEPEPGLKHRVRQSLRLHTFISDRQDNRGNYEN